METAEGESHAFMKPIGIHQVNRFVCKKIAEDQSASDQDPTKATNALWSEEAGTVGSGPVEEKPEDGEPGLEEMSVGFEGDEGEAESGGHGREKSEGDTARGRRPKGFSFFKGLLANPKPSEESAGSGYNDPEQDGLGKRLTEKGFPKKGGDTTDTSDPEHDGAECASVNRGPFHEGAYDLEIFSRPFRTHT